MMHQMYMESLMKYKTTIEHHELVRGVKLNIDRS